MLPSLAVNLSNRGCNMTYFVICGPRTRICCCAVVCEDIITNYRSVVNRCLHIEGNGQGKWLPCKARRLAAKKKASAKSRSLLVNTNRKSELGKFNRSHQTPKKADRLCIFPPDFYEIATAFCTNPVAYRSQTTQGTVDSTWHRRLLSMVISGSMLIGNRGWLYTLPVDGSHGPCPQKSERAGIVWHCFRNSASASRSAQPPGLR